MSNKFRRRLQLQSLENREVPTNLPPGFVESIVTTNSSLSSPTAMEFSPTGQLWVLQQGGLVRLIRADGSAHNALSLTVNSTGERGLLGIAFDPTYDGAGPNTDYIYLYYTSASTGGSDPVNNRLSRFTVTGAGTTTPTLGSEVILRDLPPNTEDSDSNHNGGAIHFGIDGMLYVAVGDHNYDNTPQANHVSQVTNTPFGKMLRLNPDGTNPGDNPFDTGSSTDWAGAIWALGLRNPYTFAVEPTTGEIYINDVGEGNWEEINLGEWSANYGWAGSTNPLWEGFEEDGTPPPWDNYRDPVMAYDHSSTSGAPAGVAITGGVFYPADANFGDAYAGMYLFADYGASFIRVLDPFNPGDISNPDTSLPFADALSGNPVDLKVDGQGRLYYLARGTGEIYRISYDAPVITQHPQDVVVNEGQPASFTVQANGAQPFSYQWERLIVSTWTPITGATSQTFTIPSTTLADDGEYRVVVSNSAGSAISDSAVLTVNSAGTAPNITRDPSSLTVSEGQSATFDVDVTGSQPRTYQWQKFISGLWTNILGADQIAYTIAATVPADAGQYRIVVTNQFGSDTSNAATLTVDALPAATINAPATYTFGQTINFSGTATDPEDGTLPASAYTWRVDFAHDTHFHPHVGDFSGVTNSSFMANFNEPDPDQYYRIYLTVTDSRGGQRTVTRDVVPVTVQLSIASRPGNVPITIDGQPIQGVVTSVVNMPRTIQAPDSVTIGEIVYRFDNWSNGGPATQVLPTPNVDTTLIATYALRSQGLRAEFFDFQAPLAVLPDLTGLTPDFVRTDAQVKYTNSFKPWPGLGVEFADTFVSRHTGHWLVDTAGAYRVALTSGDGSRLWIDGNLVVDNDGLHGMRRRLATVNLTAGYHDIRIESFDNTGGAGLRFTAAAPKKMMALVAADKLFHDEPAGFRSFQQDTGPNNLVVVEAENYDGSVARSKRQWLETYAPTGFAGVGAMRVMANGGKTINTGFDMLSPRLDYRINFATAGTHYVWVRGRAGGAGDDTVHVGLDGAVSASADRINKLRGKFGWTNATLDGAVATVQVDSPGWHTLNLWMREDGATVDRLLLTTSAAYVPADLGPPESPRQTANLDFSTGFAGANGLQTNGSAGVNGANLRLTPAATNQAGSAFSSQAIDVTRFSTTFDFRLTSAVADGFAFVIQGAGNTALGSNGGGLGYQGINNSVAIKFDLQGDLSEGASSTGLYTNGQAPAGGGTNLTGAGIDFHSGHDFRVSMAYVAGSLFVRIQDLTTNAVATQVYAIDIASTVGGNLAFIGFTGATSAQTAQQEILNWVV